jgi:hypothetical protein
VHVLHDEGAVLGEIPLDALVRRSAVEIGEVEVRGKAGEALGQPGAVVGPELGGALRPADVVGPEPHGRRAVARGVEKVPGILDVGERLVVALLALHGGDPLAHRVLREPWPAKGVLPGDRHLGEGLGLGRRAHLPAPRADDPQGLVDRAHRDAHRAGRAGAAAGVALPRHQELAPRLGHQQIERRLAELLRGELPQAGLEEQARGLVEREHREGRHHQVRGAALLEGPRQEAELLRLDRLHGITG